MKTFIINENDKEQRLDKFLQKAVPLLPKNLMYKYLRKKRIKINSKKCELNYKLCLGDKVELYINDEFFSENKELEFLACPSNINVVFEDENIMLVNKPQGLVVHEDNDNGIDTLINRVKHYLYDKKDYNPEEELSFAPALCNRIDRNTCGIVIVAKNAPTLRTMNEKIKQREITKKYLCLIVGKPKKSQGTIVNYIEKRADENIVRVLQNKTPNAKTAITEYEVLENRGELSLVEVNLKTGRTHQIRAHMAYMGTPIVGDGKYGVNETNRKFGYKHQALCSYKLMLNKTDELNHLSYLEGKEFKLDDVWFAK